MLFINRFLKYKILLKTTELLAIILTPMSENIFQELKSPIH